MTSPAQRLRPYIYPNTLQVVEVNGATVKEWLEMSAGQFNQIDTGKTGVQWLVNESFPTYNFDVIDGVNYEVDITQPARYSKDGVKVSDGQRISGLTFNGQPVDPAQKFYVVTNNYRASGGGHFRASTAATSSMKIPSRRGRSSPST